LVVDRNKVFIWYHLGYFLGRFKNSFLLIFNLQFLDFTYLQTWDAPARVKEYPINLLKVESLGLGIGLRFWGPSLHPLPGKHWEKSDSPSRVYCFEEAFSSNISFKGLAIEGSSGGIELVLTTIRTPN